MYVRVFVLFIWACREVTSEDEPAKVYSHPAKRGEVPWHAIVYIKTGTSYEVRCGGSIVRPTVVLSVAHCYWNETTHKLKPASNYAAAAGKVNRPWDDPEDDKYAQKIDVQSFVVPSDYRGWASSFTVDISVIILSKSFEYNQYVAPIYLDFDKNLDKLQLGRERSGKIPTWRLKTAPTLKVVEMQLMPFKECFDTVSFRFRPFILNDKFCAQTKEKDIAPCIGDTGSALAIPEKEGDETRYYLRGIYSVAPALSDTGCGEILGFTHVINHEKFLKKYLVTPEDILNFNSRLAKRGELPWHVLIYKKNSTSYELACGGSIVRPNVVISVAHCYWDNDKLVPRPASNFAVAAGKVNRPWDDPEDEKYAQKSDVISINIPSRYRGRQSHYTEDISVFILAKSFEYNLYVAPVHIDFNETFDNIQISDGTKGKMPTWRSKTAPKLKAVVLDIMPFEECFAQSTRAYRPFIGAGDKICVGTKESGVAPCQGDTGSGLVIPENVDGEIRYYLRAIYSVAPDIQADGCGEILGFTHLFKYEHFLKKYLPQIHSNPTTPEPIGQQPVPSDKCQLPAYPSNGRYKVFNAPNASPFEISDFWIVDIVCHPGFGILNGNDRHFCSSGVWSPTGKIPECVPFCSLNRNPSVQYRCRSSGSTSLETRPCNNYEPPGTIAIPECVKPNYFNADELSAMLCNSDGIWSGNPICLPACGEVTPGGVVLIRNGEYAKLGELPWHAGIYTKKIMPYKQICGGSIIRPSVVISAAHCFWDDSKPAQHKLLPASDYAVAVGKIYRPWNDQEDEKYAQKADVISINVPSRFRGITSNFMDDIAVLLLSKSFEYKPHIAPVCLSFEDHFDRQQTSKGMMAKTNDAPSTLTPLPPKILTLPIKACLITDENTKYDLLAEMFNIPRSGKKNMDQTKDEFDIYAKYVASELRNVKNDHIVLQAKYLINNILIEAREGKLTRHKMTKFNSELPLK